MIRNRISSDPEDLNELNKVYPWIPNERMIRPIPEILTEKYYKTQRILGRWNSLSDYILDVDFHYPVKEENGKYKALPPKVSEWAFTRAEFPYALPEGTTHSILWNSTHTMNDDFDDSRINELIEFILKDKTGIDSYDFAWYKNPHPTILNLYHVQVFWIRLV